MNCDVPLKTYSNRLPLIRDRSKSGIGPSRRRSSAGITLIELLVTIAIIAIASAAAMIGTGAAKNARMRSAATMITGAIRVAYARASATSRPNRLVLDLQERRVWLEETSGALVVKAKDITGGAEAVTQEEKDAVEQASKILKGPLVPRPQFRPIKAFGTGSEVDADGYRTLGAGIRFRGVFTSHSVDGQTEGRAYLYFWPGGQTERAAIQLDKGGETADEGLTILVSPLTGKARIAAGAATMDPLRDDGTSSDREDSLF